MDGVQNGEFLFYKPGEVLLLKEEEVPVPLHPPQHPAGPVHPGVQAGVDLRVDGGTLVLCEVFHQILIVVQQQHRRHRPAGLIAVPYGGQLGHVHPVGGGEKAAPPLTGADQMPIHQKAASSKCHVAGALVLAFQKPAGIEAGDHGGQLGVKQVLPVVRQLEEAVVGPDDVAALRTEDDHGQWGVDHGILGGHIHCTGDVLNVLGHLPAALAEVGPVIQPQQGHHCQFQGRQGQAEQGGGQGKHHQTDEVELEAGLKQLM